MARGHGIPRIACPCYDIVNVLRLGVDYGQKRIGLARSEDDGGLAHPVETLPNEGEAASVRAIAAAAARLEAKEIVLGLPLRMDGAEGPEARRVRRLARALEKAAAIPVILWDERLSTQEAQRALRGSGVDSRKGRAVIDQVAATILLQSYLDLKQRHGAWDTSDEDGHGLRRGPGGGEGGGEGG